jgi:hypothetical protein
MDQKIAVALQALGDYQILLGGAVARRGFALFCRRMQGFGGVAGTHFVLDKNRDGVLDCGNYEMGRCA